MGLQTSRQFVKRAGTMAGAGLLVLILLTSCNISEPRPLIDTSVRWKLVEGLSDEFNKGDVDTIKWDDDPQDWGVWSWEPYNAYTKGGCLHIRMEYAPHIRDEQKLFYKSGILVSRGYIQYGYFEARIKGCPRFPGACPAFWVTGSTEVDGKRVGAEIDFMEVQETPNNIRKVDCCLHGFRYDENGKKVPIHERRYWIAPWDPRDDFHVYGCEWNEEKITWYIDGKQVVEAANWHWKIPLQVYLSMGLRPPFLRREKDDEGNRIRFPVPEVSTDEGFPTEMLVDYVRVWQKSE